MRAVVFGYSNVGDRCLRVLRARLYEAERERRQAELSATRKSQIGSGDRSEKIRTYNYPDSRVTDHRVKVTLNLEKVLPGGLDDFTDALQAVVDVAQTYFGGSADRKAKVDAVREAARPAPAGTAPGAVEHGTGRRGHLRALPTPG